MFIYTKSIKLILISLLRAQWLNVTEKWNFKNWTCSQKNRNLLMQRQIEQTKPSKYAGAVMAQKVAYTSNAIHLN